MAEIMTNFTAGDMLPKKKAVASNPPKVVKREKAAKSVPAPVVEETAPAEETVADETPSEE